MISVKRFSALGVQSLEDLARVLPLKYHDLRKDSLLECVRAKAPHGEGALAIKLFTDVSWDYSLSPPRGTALGKDAQGEEVRLNFFGSPWRYKESPLVPGNVLLIEGKIKQFNNEYSINVSEIFPSYLSGRILPVYPSSRQASSNTIRETIAAHWQDILPRAVKSLEKKLPPNWQTLVETSESLADILTTIHFPQNEADIHRVVSVLQDLNALSVLYEAKETQSPIARVPLEVSRRAVEESIRALPFALTEDQHRAIEEILKDLRRPQAMRRLLTGDVGSGKTVCYLVPAHALAQSGYQSAILIPNVILAKEVYRSCTTFFPDCPVFLQTGEERIGDPNTAKIFIGTTSLLFNPEVISSIDFFITDEQQRFSRDQREGKAMKDEDPDLPPHVHRLEVSATPIPRSMALAELGFCDVSRLAMPHAKKRIHTSLWGPEDKKIVFERLIEQVRQGKQIAIVYPLKEPGAQDSDRIRDVESAYQKWRAQFGDLVRHVHGAMSDAEKNAVIDDMKAKRAQILVTTSVIEVGITIENLSAMLIVDAHRFGLSQLHQLRGRLVRHGGEGYFEMLIPEGMDEARKRLRAFCSTQDGFVIARKDLALRGQGDIHKDEQSGKTRGFLLPPRHGLAKISMERLDRFSEAILGTQTKPDPHPFIEDKPAVTLRPSQTALSL